VWLTGNFDDLREDVKSRDDRVDGRHLWGERSQFGAQKWLQFVLGALWALLFHEGLRRFLLQNERSKWSRALRIRTNCFVGTGFDNGF
jgi:hypothetical protein